MSALTQARLRKLLHYDPITGIFKWLVDRGGTAKSGTVAGSVEGNGYTCISVDGKLYKAHRLAFLYMTGSWPHDLVDHKDLNRSHNAWENIREANRTQNKTNTSPYKNNKLGLKGVTRHKDVFRATIQINGKSKHIGLFKTPEEAHEAYVRVAGEAFGEYARAS